jgi:MFS family permease
MMSEGALAQEARFWPQLAALSLAMLLPSLGTSIANVALPTLATSFDAPIAGVQWVVIAYLLSVTCFIVGAGRLSDIIGRSRLLLMGIKLFAAASAACAVAPSLWFLVGARAVQGLGAAAMMALTVAMVGDLVPKDRTGSAMGLLGTVSAVGTALGPTLGGVLIAAFGWPAIFALLAVLGGVTVLIGRALFPTDANVSHQSTGFDGTGTVLLALALFAFSSALTLGARMSGPAVTALAVLSVLGVTAFLRHEARTPAPLVRMDLLRDRALSTCLLSMALVSAILMATLVVGPFYLSGALGLGPVKIGLVMSVGPGVAALTGAPAGRLVDRRGSFRVIVAGLMTVATGSVLLTVLPGRFGVGGYVVSLVVITFGYALFQAANTTAVMQGATSDRRGVTSALLGLSRNLGLISGASAMGAVYAAGPRIAEIAGFGVGDETGLRLTFVVAAGLAGLALGTTWWGHRRD